MTWTDVKANIVVKNVASAVTSDPWDIHETSLVLMDCDSAAQRSFFHTFELDSFGSKQYDPPLMASDWCVLNSRILDAISVDEINGVGEIVKKANP